MKIFIDENQQLNLNPTVVYFRLPEQDYLEYADKLKRLGKRGWFSYGMLRFRAVQIGKRKGNSALSDELRAAMSKCNIFRLKLCHSIHFFVEFS